MKVNCCSRTGSIISATVHRANEVRSDVDALSSASHLAIYLMKAYEAMAHCVGRFTKAIVVLTRATGVMDAIQIFTKVSYFVLGGVKKDVKYVCKIVGKVFMTVADAFTAMCWLGALGVKALGRHAAKFALAGSVFAIAGFAAFTGHSIQILAQNSGKVNKGLEIANGSFGLISAVAETASIIAALVTGQIFVLLALGIFAKCMSLTSFFIGAAAAKKEEREANTVVAT